MAIVTTTPAETPPHPSPKPYESPDPLERQWADPKPTLLGRLSAVQNDAIGIRYLATSFAFFLIGGVNALLMRTQLAVPENTFLSPDRYNQLFTMHGSTMMYLFAVPIVEGFAILVLPFMLGNREMPFPRLGVFSYFTFLMGGVLFYLSFLFNDVPDTGWYAYVPLSGPVYSPGRALDFWLLALSVSEIAAIAAGVEIVIAILKMRAIGMTIGRLPLFGWAMLVTAFSLLFAFVPLIVASLLMELDRQLGTRFYDPGAGGSPVLWQHLFWIFGHPEVYIQFIPAVGMVSMIIPVFARRGIVGHAFVAMAIVATGFISFGLWVHHMFTVGLPLVALAFFSAASTLIAIPSGVQVFSWIATLWRGRPVWSTPLLFSVGFIVTFVLGGITGVMVGSVPADWQLHDSYFVVAHFHYVLIGGVVFPLFAAFYYWLPKFSGRLLDERLGRWHFWLVFIGFHLAFFPMHISGMLGMPRRVYTYAAGLGWEPFNLLSTIGAFILGAGTVVFVVNLILSWQHGRPAGDNPWDGDTLEWATASPPVNYGFRVLPIVRSLHPLWERDGPWQGDDRLAKLVRALGEWPTQWRAAVITGTFDGAPEEVFRVTGPSIWPFITSIGVIVVFTSEIFRNHTLTLIGLLIAVAGAIAWNWPEKVSMSEAEEEQFEREHRVDVRAGGSLAISRWAMWMAILILGIGLASLLFSYFFLRLENGAWPPPGIPQPGLVPAGVAALVLSISGGAMHWAMRAIRRGNQRGLRLGMAAAFVLALAALGVQGFDLAQFDLGLTAHAYGSIFYLLAGFAFSVLLGGLIIGGLVQAWAWQGQYTARRHQAVANAHRYWWAAIANWIIVFAALYLTPLLT